MLKPATNIFPIFRCEFHSMSLQQLDCNHWKNFCLLQLSTMWVNQEDREYFACSQKFIVSWNLLGGGMCTVCDWNFVAGERCVCAILQAIEVLDATAVNIQHCQRVLSSDMITIFHARAGYKFRFVTVEIAGTLIKLPVEGEKWKEVVQGVSVSGVSVTGCRQGGGARDWGNCLVCKRITSHMLCHKKSTTSWQTSDKYASFLTATPTLALSRTPLSLQPALSFLLSVVYCVCNTLDMRGMLCICVCHTQQSCDCFSGK